MKVRIISTPITPYGSFEKGQVLTTAKYPKAFLDHLVDDANAAERIEAKMETPVIENKMVKNPAPVKKAITNASMPAKKKRGRPPKRS